MSTVETKPNRTQDPRIREVLRRYRYQHQLTVQDLAREAGLSPYTLYKMEWGEHGAGAKSISRLGKVFGPEFVTEMLALAGEE